MLINPSTSEIVIAGCDEAGRGCLVGPVVAAAVVFSENFCHSELNDSKVLNAATRERLALVIKANALSYGIGIATESEIDQINILQASFLAMHRALSLLRVSFQKIVVDGNRFRPFHDIPHECIVKGDAKIVQIAAASILAKTTRDAIMHDLHTEYPYYGWNKNMGYPTCQHREALLSHGISPYHRKTYKTVACLQPRLFDSED